MPGDRLEEYRRKREFGRTPEPAGAVAAAPPPISRFVVQKHAASRLHYDFRLELAGVLVSWAVPKGPSLDPADRRLAVHVEDHPVEYFDFEGTIPKGEYGGGTVMVWDWGGVRWLGDDPEAMLARGDLKFELYGRKVKGSFAIVNSSGDKNWFLIKKRDEAAAPGVDVTQMDLSVRSGRSMEEIAAGHERTWHSGQPASGQAAAGPGFVDLGKAKKASFPGTLAPMLASPCAAPFDDERWMYELKLDGFRTIALIREGRVRLLSRRGLDATRQYPELAGLGRLTRARTAVLDGEVVALDELGRPSFQKLQERTGWKGGRTALEPHPSIPVIFYVFDIPYFDGQSLAEVPLSSRRALLDAVLLDGPSVRLLDRFGGDDGTLFFDAVKGQGGEGVVAKRLSSGYRAGERSKAWLKIKSNPEQSCLIAGYSPPAGGRAHFGSLAVAVLDGDRLVYAGQVGSGFNESLLASIKEALDARLAAAAQVEGWQAAPRGTTWVRPELGCDVKFNEWTREGVLRQPTFLRLRPELEPADCRRERTAPGDGRASVKNRKSGAPPGGPPA